MLESPAVRNKEQIFIGVDWGGTHVRASLMNAAAANPVESRVARVPYRRGDAAHLYLSQFVADWFREYAEAPVLLCGMVTSREGWCDSGHIDCPAELDGLADSCVAIERNGRRYFFVPGMRSSVPEFACHDLIRGEETQLLGLLEQERFATQVVCLPGTHSKWAVLEHRKLARFRTFMTGEIYELLMRHSILRYSAQGPGRSDNDSFRAGLKAAQGNGNLLSDVFLIRALDISGKLSKSDASSYLSGLLVGTEIAAAREFTEHVDISLLASGRLASVYSAALKDVGCRVTLFDSERMTWNGLQSIAARLGVIGEVA